ncbi:MAG: acyl-CoA dehydrogenase family protein [Gammaproteobacteria bacterium]|nr:acyl-CoA dehydrogenase family protein [Gammaproteobacteria bacterium]
MNLASSLPAIDAIADRARQRSAEIEAARCLPDDLAGDLATAGVFRMLVPAEHGGLEVHPQRMIDVLRTLGRADAATGWCAMVGATTGSLAASLPEAWARADLGRGPGRHHLRRHGPWDAPAVQDGWQVTGRWPFGSASGNARWICGGAMITDDDGTPVKTGSGAPDIRLMIFDAADVIRHDNWHVSGLCGTGSGDIEVRDLFVPAGREVVLGGRPRVTTPLYRFPTFGLLALGVGSVALGIGERALEEFLDLAGGKKPTGSRRTLADRERIQGEVARSEAALAGARALMRESVDRAWQAAEAGEPLTTRHRADLRLAAVHATWSAVEVVDRCYHAGGGTAIHAASPLQRCFRDVHVATQHVMVAEPVWELTGRVYLGMDVGGML